VKFTIKILPLKKIGSKH